MTKGKRLLVILSAALLIAAFLVVLFLSLPFGDKPTILPALALYVTGGVIGGVFLIAAGYFLISARRGG